MPIDPKKVKWDNEKIDPAGVVWDEEQINPEEVVWDERPGPSLSALPKDYQEHEILEPGREEPGKYSLFPEHGESVYDAAERAARKVTPQLGKYGANVQQFMGEALLPTMFGDNRFFEQVGERGREDAEELQRRINKINEEKPGSLQGRLWDNLQHLKDPRYLLENTGEVAVSLAPTIAAWFVGGKPLMGVAGGIMEGGNLYHELVEDKVDPVKAGLYSTAYGVVSGILNSFGAGKVMDALQGKLVIRRMAGLVAPGVWEAATEYAEEPFEAAAGALARGKGWDGVVEDTLQSLTNIDVIPGSLLLGTGSAVAGLPANRRAEAAKRVLEYHQDMKRETDPEKLKVVAADHLEQHGLKETVVFSAEKSQLDKDINKQNTEEAEQTLREKGIPYRKVQGMYEGESETSFIVPNIAGAGDLARSLAEKYGQESILVVDGNGKPLLASLDGTVEELPGVIQEVSKEQAKQSPGYTYDTESGKYFTNVEQVVSEQPATEPDSSEFGEVMKEVSGTTEGVTPEPSGLLGINITKRQEPIRGIESINPEVEARMLAARGLPSTTIGQRLAETGRKLKAETQHFRWLDYHKDGAVIDTLRREEASPAYNKARARDVGQWILAGLDKSRIRIFERNLILAEMMEDVEAGRLPEKYLSSIWGHKNYAELAQDYAKFRLLAEKNPKVQQALDKRQRFQRGFRAELVKRDLESEEILNNEHYFHHQVLSHMAAKTTGTYSKDVRLHRKGWQMSRSGKPYQYNTEYVTAEYEVISQAFAQMSKQDTLNKLDPQANIAENIIEEAKARDREWKRMDDLKDLFPDDYETWQPTPGSHFFPALSTTEKILGEVFAGMRELTPEDFKTVLAVGKRKSEWVIPSRLAKTLNEFRDFREEGMLGHSLAALNTSWKQWTLLNPYRVVKYNINNMSGDLDIVLAYNPKILKHFKSSLKETWRYKKGKTAQGDIREALQGGVVDSGMTIHEIADITKVGFYRALMGENPNAVTKYWDSVKSFTTFRENILRLAAYKHFKAEIKAGKKVYGASNPYEVDAIIDPNEKAAKLARELIGDYGNISHAGQWIRRNAIPFYSWMEINAPRYIRLVRNIKYEEGGSRGRVGAVAGWAATKKAGSLAFKASLLFNLGTIWNIAAAQMLGISEDERRRLTKDRNQFHIILGRGEEGRIITMKFQGALSEFLNWGSLENFWDDAKDLMGGKLEPKEKLMEMVKAPVEKLLHGAVPIPKTLAEMLMKKSFYPNPWPGQQRNVRDPWEHFARSWSLDMPYRYLAGKPTRGFMKEAVGTLAFYSRDPNEQAFYDNYNTTWKFLKDIGKAEERLSSTPTKKRNALYYLRQAIKYGDKKAADKYWQKYTDLGGKPEGVRKSIERMHPLAAIPEDLKGRFIASLSAQERRTLESAFKWYEETFLLCKQFE